MLQEACGIGRGIPGAARRPRRAPRRAPRFRHAATFNKYSHTHLLITTNLCCHLRNLDQLPFRVLKTLTGPAFAATTLMAAVGVRSLCLARGPSTCSSSGASSRCRASRGMRVFAATSTGATRPGTEASTSLTSSSNQNSTSVRILRYPDGHERTIYYPAEVVSAAEPELKVELEPEEVNWSLWTQTDEVNGCRRVRPPRMRCSR